MINLQTVGVFITRNQRGSNGVGTSEFSSNNDLAIGAKLSPTGTRAGSSGTDDGTHTTGAVPQPVNVSGKVSINSSNSVGLFRERIVYSPLSSSFNLYRSGYGFLGGSLPARGFGVLSLFMGVPMRGYKAGQ